MSVHMNRWINTVTYLKFVWYICVRGRYSICAFTFCLTSLAFVFAVDIRFVSLLFALLRSQSRSRSYVRTYVASDCSFVLLLTRLTNISHWFKYIVSDLERGISNNYSMQFLQFLQFIDCSELQEFHYEFRLLSKYYLVLLEWLLFF